IVLRRDRTELRYPYPYFVDYFKRWFLTNPAFGKTYDDRYRLLFAGGLRITTTLDPGVQAAAQDAVSSVLTYPSDPDAAVTVLDPRTGYVRAMVGGKDAAYWANDAAGRVNLATGMGGSGRQTGSAFKAFALVTAPEPAVAAISVRGPRIQRGEHARDGERVRNARDGRTSRRPRAGHDGVRRQRQPRVAGGPAPAAGRQSRRGGGRGWDPAGHGPVRPRPLGQK